MPLQFHLSGGEVLLETGDAGYSSAALRTVADARARFAGPECFDLPRGSGHLARVQLIAQSGEVLLDSSDLPSDGVVRVALDPVPPEGTWAHKVYMASQELDEASLREALRSAWPGTDGIDNFETWRSETAAALRKAAVDTVGSWVDFWSFAQASDSYGYYMVEPPCRSMDISVDEFLCQVRHWQTIVAGLQEEFAELNKRTAGMSTAEAFEVAAAKLLLYHGQPLRGFKYGFEMWYRQFQQVMQWYAETADVTDCVDAVVKDIYELGFRSYSVPFDGAARIGAAVGKTMGVEFKLIDSTADWLRTRSKLSSSSDLGLGSADGGQCDDDVHVKFIDEVDAQRGAERADLMRAALTQCRADACSSDPLTFQMLQEWHRLILGRPYWEEYRARKDAYAQGGRERYPVEALEDLPKRLTHMGFPDVGKTVHLIKHQPIYKCPEFAAFFPDGNVPTDDLYHWSASGKEKFNPEIRSSIGYGGPNGRSFEWAHEEEMEKHGGKAALVEAGHILTEPGVPYARPIVVQGIRGPEHVMLGEPINREIPCWFVHNFRQYNPNESGRSMTPYCSYKEKFERCLADATSTEPVCLRAARAYLDICFFHPFEDGNGRLARLLMDFVFTRAGMCLRDVNAVFVVPNRAEDEEGATAMIKYFEKAVSRQGPQHSVALASWQKNGSYVSVMEKIEKQKDPDEEKVDEILCDRCPLPRGPQHRWFQCLCYDDVFDNPDRHHFNCYGAFGSLNGADPPTRKTDRKLEEEAQISVLQSIFKFLDKEHRGLISCADVKPLWEVSGWLCLDEDSTDVDANFLAVCTEHGFSAEDGISEAAFVGGGRHMRWNTDDVSRCQDSKSAVFEEYLRWLRAGPNVNGHYVAHEKRKEIQLLAITLQLFRALDKDGDGFLSASEFYPFAEILCEELKLFIDENSGFVVFPSPVLRKMTDDEVVATWSNTYMQICKTHGVVPEKGFSETAFTKYARDNAVNDEVLCWAYAQICRGAPPAGHQLPYTIWDYSRRMICDCGSSIRDLSSSERFGFNVEFPQERLYTWIMEETPAPHLGVCHIDGCDYSVILIPDRNRNVKDRWEIEEKEDGKYEWTLVPV